ncbi:MAG TPA: hypothetical protein DCX95_02735 [Elusimicrobia bacterium]|nr:hypothetical protein [Elusimicrobiota bacterium]
MSDNINDLEIIESTLNGNTDAFAVLVEKYKDKTFNIVFRMINDYHETEDIVQEAFVKAFKELKNFKIQYKFSTWLFAIALNIAKNRLKRKSLLKFLSLDRKKETQDDEIVWEIADGKLTPEEELIKKEEAKKINEFVYELPINYREVFILRNFEDMSYEEISKITGLPMGTVETRLFRASKIFSQKYKFFFDVK